MQRPVISTPLLLKYMKVKDIPIVCEKEFDQSYVMSMPTCEFAFDELVEWAREELGRNEKGIF